MLSSALIGAALAAAGVAYQAILRNPLADPYLLGVSSGASLFAYAWQLPAFACGEGARGAGAVERGDGGVYRGVGGGWLSCWDWRGGAGGLSR